MGGGRLAEGGLGGGGSGGGMARTSCCLTSLRQSLLHSDLISLIPPVALPCKFVFKFSPD